MHQYFYVLYSPDKFGFYRDCRWLITEDIMMADRFHSKEEAKRECKSLCDSGYGTWVIKKVMVTVE